MRNRAYAIVLGVIALLIFAGVATNGFGGKLERWLLRLHGVPVDAAAPAWRASTPGPPSPEPSTTDPTRGVASLAGWPDTRAGAIARRWVESFSNGEQAMRECLADILAPESLAMLAMDDRMERYRALQERFGALVLVKVESSSPGELVATLAASDLSQRRFTFSVQSAPPFKLISVSFADQVHGLQGGFHH